MPNQGPSGVRWLRICLVTCALLAIGCHKAEDRLEPRFLTWAELRAVHDEVLVTPPGEGERHTYPRERLADGAKVRVEAGGLAWLRRDAGATLLVRGPARLTLRAHSLTLDEGRAFVDTPVASSSEVVTPAGKLTLAAVRASIEVTASGSTKAYVLSGEVRSDKVRARAGEELALATGGKSTVTPVLGWDDWTGGLATTDMLPAPAPFGVGTVGARTPGEQGTPRFPLSIQRMDVRVSIEGDYAVTEVDQSFFNPSSETVEGAYGFRTPEPAILQRFGVDRDGVVVWGRVKEKAAAAAQYQANVYQGSTEDPALLEWDAPGQYRARLYPIRPGETRRVVVRYGEWLARGGEQGQRRLYVYPMAAQGSEESLPHIEELKVTFDLARAGARDLRVGMAGVRSGDQLVVREHDFVPRADLALELLDEGVRDLHAYRARQSVDLEALPPSARSDAAKKADGEADYVLVPVRAPTAKLPSGGLDLAIVVDSSAATEAATLSLARAATTALLAHLGDDDRAVVFAGDDGLRPVVPAIAKPTKLDAALRNQVRDGLSRIARGGATDLGAMLAAAARELDPSRRSAVVYIGDAAPTVGELSLGALRERLSKLPSPVRIFGLGVGDGARLDILAGLAQGAFAERINDGYSAATSALRVLEEAERPVWLGTKIDLGTNVERVLPGASGAIVAGDTLWVLGRIASGKDPERLRLTGPSGQTDAALKVERVDDRGDLGHRWAEARLQQMLEAGEGRAALVDLGMKHGIITPVTSFYVPTKNEMAPDELQELQARADDARRQIFAPGLRVDEDQKEADIEAPPTTADNREGGTGTRAKGEEGSMGRAQSSLNRAAMAPPAAAAPMPADAEVEAKVASAPREANAPAPGSPAPSRAEALKEARNFGIIGSLGGKDDAARAPAVAASAAATTTPTPDAAPEPPPMAEAVAQQASPVRPMPKRAAFGVAGKPSAHGALSSGDPSARGNMFGDGIGDAFGSGGLGLSGTGAGGGGRGGGLAKGLASLDIDKTTKNEKHAPSSGEKEVVLVDAPQSTVNINIFVGALPRRRLGCSAAADAPFAERMGLWRERLSKTGGNAYAVAEVYRSALAACEAPSYRERSRLLSLMLDVMPGVASKVALYRLMGRDWGAADVLYRSILARVRTPEEVRDLHRALGLKTVDPSILAKLVASTTDTAERARKLAALAQQFPDDLTLALALLDAYEDASDFSAARDHARKLRLRPDADANVRTAVGELYLRLAERAENADEKAAMAAEGRRAFGEIVEFAPEDPVARRRLGDLLLAHGFFVDAARQYETLARLTPDENRVQLLQAAAAEGQGLLEEALKWAEKAGASGPSDGASGPAVTARALSATHLAWARLAASQAGKADELEALSARATRLLSGGGVTRDPSAIRVTLTWSHPELHPSLWTNALGTPMPAPDGDITLGVAQALVPEHGDAFVEVRLEPGDVDHAARLGATAELTVVWDELGKGEKIVRKRIGFARGGPPTQRYLLKGKELQNG